MANYIIPYLLHYTTLYKPPITSCLIFYAILAAALKLTTYIHAHYKVKQFTDLYKVELQFVSLLIVILASVTYRVETR